MFTIPTVKATEMKKNFISKEIKICLECGSKEVEELEFAISCEDCGSLLLRS